MRFFYPFYIKQEIIFLFSPLIKGSLFFVNFFSSFRLTKSFDTLRSLFNFRYEFLLFLLLVIFFLNKEITPCFLDYEISLFLLIFNKIWIKKIITYYISLLFFIRSFFIKERPYFVPLIILMITVNSFWKFLPIVTTFSSQIYILALTGIYLIGIDSFCSFISQIIEKETPGIFDGILTFLQSESKSSFIEYFKSTGLTALIIGKTAMTATGRAALGASLFAGSFLITNTIIQGKQQASENQKNREFQAAENQKNREFQNQQFKKSQEWNSYNSSWNPFKRPPQD